MEQPKIPQEMPVKEPTPEIKPVLPDSPQPIQLPPEIVPDREPLPDKPPEELPEKKV
jgi:hypothetical protein